jgi:hypothetical protein
VRCCIEDPEEELPNNIPQVEIDTTATAAGKTNWESCQAASLRRCGQKMSAMTEVKTKEEGLPEDESTRSGN